MAVIVGHHLHVLRYIDNVVSSLRVTRSAGRSIELSFEQVHDLSYNHQFASRSYLSGMKANKVQVNSRHQFATRRFVIIIRCDMPRLGLFHIAFHTSPSLMVIIWGIPPFVKYSCRILGQSNICMPLLPWKAGIVGIVIFLLLCVRKGSSNDTNRLK